MGTHPDDAELAAYLANALAPEREAAVLAHLEPPGCAECAAAIERLDAGPQSGSEAVSADLRTRLLRIGSADAGPPPPVPGYEIVRELGRGGMGVVYLARDPVGRLVALKLIANAAYADPIRKDRFLREGHLGKDITDRVRALPSDERPAFAEVYEVIETDNVVCIVMEYAAGGSLHDRCQDFAAAPREAARLIAEAANAVNWLNAQSPAIFHRDCKPENFLLQPTAGVPPDGREPLSLASLSVRVADFGLATRTGDPRFTKPGSPVGTQHYWAPELLNSNAQASPRTEVYALAATLYELLTGKPPFAQEAEVDLLTAIRTGHPSRPGRPGVAILQPLQAICLKGLERHPQRRYATAGELAADLRRFLSGEQIVARLPSVHRRLGRWCVKNPVPAVGFAVLALIAVAGTSGAYAATVQASLQREQRDRLGEKYDLLLKLGLAAGDSREVLNLFAQAQAEGLVLTPEMRLHYIQGLAGVHDVAAVCREVDTVALDDLPPAVRGQYELWRATTRFGTNDEEAMLYLTAALSRPLPPADREYAEGLQAKTNDEAVVRFREAIRLDHLHQPARSDACLLLFSLGRLEEAIQLARESAELMPQHSDFQVVLATAYSFRMNDVQADKALNRLRHLLPEGEYTALSAILPALRDGVRNFRARLGYCPPGGNDIESRLVQFIRAAQQGEAFRAKLPPDDTLRSLFDRLPPGVRQRLKPYPQIMNAGVFEGGFNDLLRAAEIQPEGLLLVWTAMAVFDQPKTKGDPLLEFVERVRLQADLAERAANAHSILPIKDIALDLAIMCHERFAILLAWVLTPTQPMPEKLSNCYMRGNVYFVGFR